MSDRDAMGRDEAARPLRDRGEAAAERRGSLGKGRVGKGGGGERTKKRRKVNHGMEDFP